MHDLKHDPQNDSASPILGVPLAAAEVVTRSTPTAAHLLLAGHQPIGVDIDANGAKVIRFAPSAAETFERFVAAKRRLDAWLGQHPAGNGGARR